MSGDIRAAIVARVPSHAGLLAQIGARMYLMEAPQRAVTPYVTFQVISAARSHEMTADSLGLPRVQFDCWGSDREEALNTRDQVIAAYSRLTGTYASTYVDSSVCVNDGMDVQTDETSLIPRVTCEFEMSYRLG